VPAGILKRKMRSLSSIMIINYCIIIIIVIIIIIINTINVFIIITLLIKASSRNAIRKKIWQ